MNRTAMALLLVAALAAGGCAAAVGAGVGAGAGYGAYRYAADRLETTYHKPYEQVYDATLSGLKDMNIAVTKVQKDAVGAKIDAKRADGTGVSIDLSKTGAKTTGASIKVGTFGDEDASRAIASNIAQRLGEERGRGAGQGSEGIGAQ